jgi:CSLREA domain-containing protein
MVSYQDESKIILTRFIYLFTIRRLFMFANKSIRRMSPVLFNLVTMLALLFGSALIVTPVYAAGITVNTSADENNTGAGCSLREAITAANTDAAYGGCTAGSGTDTITLPAGTYTLTIAGAGEDANTTGDLDITGPLTINGAGGTIIQAGATPGSGIDRVFDVIGAIPVNISDVTIENGKCTACNGGGILNGGTLTVTNSVFLANSAQYGGGISNNNGGTLTVMNSTFSGNSASVGGGIQNDSGMVDVANSTFSGNSSVGGQGGGIYNLFSNLLTVTNSTFSANSANYGGGIMNFGSLTVKNSTFSANSAIDGGGIWNFSTLQLINTILANSTSSGDCYNDSGNTIATNTNNLLETNVSPGHLCGTPAVTTDPGLGVLADNGGPTQTFAITSTSSAFNAGDNATCAATDQRGVTRPQGAQCDIGAYESTVPTVVSSARVNSSPTSLANVDFTVTFSEPVTGVDMAGPTFNDFTLTSAGISSASVTAVSGSSTTYTVTVNTGSGNGTLRLNVVPGGSIVDAALNPLAAGFTTGQIYSVIKTVTFADVPTSYWAYSYIERLYNAGITSGCGTNPLIYCPDATVTRAQMAIFLLRGMHGSTYAPPDVGASTGFNDVAPTDFAAAWIKQLALEGITGGCAPSLYCPNATVTRAQMAIFLLRGEHGPTYAPPAVGPAPASTMWPPPILPPPGLNNWLPKASPADAVPACTVPPGASPVQRWRSFWCGHLVCHNMD